MAIEIMNLIMRATVSGESGDPSANSGQNANPGSGGSGGGGMDKKAIAKVISEALKNTKER